MKNFAFAFQTGAAFNNNKAFTSAAIKLAELNSKVKIYKKALYSLNNTSTTRIMRQAQLTTSIERYGKALDSATNKQKRYQALATAQVQLSLQHIFYFRGISKYRFS